MIHMARFSPNRWFYFGTQGGLKEAKPVSWFWFIEDVTPYRRGTGWRIKVSPSVAVHVGFARRTPATSTEEALGGYSLEVDAKTIREWYGNSNQQEEPPSNAGEGEGTAPEAAGSGSIQVR